jgi:hypothetical protein
VLALALLVSLFVSPPVSPTVTLPPPGGSCLEFPGDPSLVAPDSSSVLLGIDVDAFAQTSTGAALLSAFAADLALAEVLEVAEDCRLDPADTYALVLARDPGDGRMLAVQARGLGEAATLDCLASELRARNDGRDPWVASPDGCFPSLVIAPELGGGRIWIANPFTLVWARGSAFEGAIAAKLAGDTALGLPNTLASELAHLDRSGHLWLAARLDAEARAALPGVWAKDAEALTVAANFGRGSSRAGGLRVVLSLAATTTTALASTRDRLIASIVALADRLDDYGVDHQLRERARVGIVAADVEAGAGAGLVAAELEFAEAELRQIRAKVGEHIRGRGPL